MTGPATAIAAVARVFPGATTGSDLVPGVPKRVLDLAEQLEVMASGMAAADRLLQGASTSGWHGAAADACVQLMRSMPQPYAASARAMRSAAGCVAAHAAVLGAAQRDADHAVGLDLRATAAQPADSTSADAARTVALQQQARDLVTAASARVRGSAAEAAEALRAAAAEAPDRPGSLLRLVHAVMALQKELQLGAVESAAATVTALGLYSPNRLAIDPDGWQEDLAAGVAASAEAGRHPLQTAKALVNVEDMVDNPGRWAGSLTPDIALGVASGGAALVANRGASVGVRLAAAAPTARGAEVRAAIRSAQSTSRSRLRARDLRAYASAPNEFGHVSRLTAAQQLVTAALLRDARWAEPDITRRVQIAGSAIGASPMGLTEAAKGRVSLYRKASERLAGHALDDVVPAVNDTVRYTYVVPADDYVEAAGTAAAALRAQGLLLVQHNNAWGGKRYQGLNTTYIDPRTGRLVEVQLHTSHSWQATVATHDSYERFRQIGIPAAEKAMHEQTIRAAFATVPRPAGIDRLGDVLAAQPRLDATNAPPQLLSVHPWAVPVATGTAAATSLSSGHDDRGERELQHDGPRHHGRGQP